MTNVSGMLGLSTPRDAFFNSLSKFAVPTTVVSSLEAWVENPPVMTPRSTTAAITEGLGLSGPMQPPSLSERNLACLKVFIGCALFLAGSLGESWYAVLDALQTADGVLVLMSRTGAPAKKGLFGGNMATTPSTSAQPKSASLAASQLQAAINAGHTNGGTAHKHPLLSDLEIEMVLTAIQRLFDSSKNLDDPAFKAFVNALCKLSAEMVGMQASDLAIQVDQSDAEESGGNLGVPIHQSQENVVQRRRVSGIYIPKNMVRGILPTSFFAHDHDWGHLAKVWGLWDHQVGRGCFAEHPSPHLSFSRHCMDFNHEPSSYGHSTALCPPNYSYSGRSTPGRDPPRCSA